MDFNRVVLQHKKEYMVKKWRQRRKNGVFPYYLRFIIEKEKNLYPSFKKSPLFKMNGKLMFGKQQYSRYYSLQQHYRKRTKMKIRFIQVKIIEKVLTEYFYIRHYSKFSYSQYNKGNTGLRRGFYGDNSVLTHWADLVVPTKLLASLRYDELKSLGEGPFSDTSDYHLNYSTLALNFHRCFLNQYNEFLFIKNEKANKGFITLKNYLNDEKYIHDVLHTMPGALWSDNEVIKPIQQGLFESNQFNVDDSIFLKKIKSDMLEIEYINELNTDTELINGLYDGSFLEISLHIDPVNTKFFLNNNLKHDDEKPAMWKAIMRVWYAYDREHMMELNDDWYYIFRFYPYVALGTGMFFPAFYTRKKLPERLAGYKPWAKKPRYVPYMKTLYLPFQKKRFIKEKIRATSRLNISILTKFLVFSFFLFLIFV
jgi:hypothetical protein